MLFCSTTCVRIPHYSTIRYGENACRLLSSCHSSLDRKKKREDVEFTQLSKLWKRRLSCVRCCHQNPMIGCFLVSYMNTKVWWSRSITRHDNALGTKWTRWKIESARQMVHVDTYGKVLNQIRDASVGFYFRVLESKILPYSTKNIFFLTISSCISIFISVFIWSFDTYLINYVYLIHD